MADEKKGGFLFGKGALEKAAQQGGKTEPIAPAPVPTPDGMQSLREAAMEAARRSRPDLYPPEKPATSAPTKPAIKPAKKLPTNAELIAAPPIKTKPVTSKK